MKFYKLTLLISLLGIITLMFFAQSKQYESATIKDVKISNSKVIITLIENNVELIIFKVIELNLTKGDKISYKGKPGTYKGKKQILIEKLYKKQ